MFVLCLSNGDLYGMGSMRGRELGRAMEELGHEESDVTVLDHHNLK